jgi:hypothetical protein
VYLTDHEDSLKELRLDDKIDTLSFWQQKEVLNNLRAFLEPRLSEHGMKEDEVTRLPNDILLQCPTQPKLSSKFALFGKRKQSTKSTPVSPTIPKLLTSGTKWSVKLEEVCYRWETDLNLLESTSREIIVFRSWTE